MLTAASGSPSVNVMPGAGVDVDLCLNADPEGSRGGAGADGGGGVEDEQAGVRDAIDDTQNHVWSNCTRLGTATVEDYESNDEKQEGDDKGEDEDDFDSESEEEEEYNGLPPEDMINEDFERELAEIVFHSRTAI
ncbi:hypothetical protein L208DRAFT_1383125 [Tricholoma matsutake]|nr:hypothetical protein L208DRAFT_1383125 [Tricholoma matsutake 945]